MAVLIDTSVLVRAERRGAPLERMVGNEERSISVITASELLHGVHRAESNAIRSRRRAFVEQLLAHISPLPVTVQIARVHSEIRAQLQQAGTPVDAHDLWIAATALTHGFGLATLDARHFGRVPGLRVLAI
jgi:tRNA(fMet)-specific endonuclease VapC